jgi:hypothetical protein
LVIGCQMSEVRGQMSEVEVEVEVGGLEIGN